ncbi:MAG: type ISP restriction/modification enzyme [Terracidiphilus sp.]
MPPVYTVADYVTDLRAIRSTGSATAETSYYPPVDRLFNAVGQTLHPAVLFSTQLRDSGAGLPDGGFFPQPKRQRRSSEPEPLRNPERGVVEIKPADYSLDTLTTEPQTLRYLRQYGLVFITNLREFRLLQLTPSGSVQTVEPYILAATPADLWSAPLSTFAKHKDLLPDFLARVMLHSAPLVQPKDVAWLLASYAREARARAEDHPLGSFEAVKRALQESLGMKFEGEKGEHFFRSTLVQTLFYGIFSAWVLWRRTPEGRAPGAHFDWRLSAYYLRVPVLRKLFGEVSEPGALNSIQLQEVLNRAGEALNRVQPAFFDTFREDDAVAYFYEPFLEAFDPQLRKDLGVWYTPKEIVNYMVERVDHLLRTQLNQPLGLASPAVRILDPCCGTGAYLTAVLHRIHRTLLENAGDDSALVPNSLRTAALTRVFGFEIMPAPFVISHLQIAALLEREHAPLTDQHRAGVYLTNALTGWVPERHPQSVIFREFEKEREDSEHIKQQGTILVILGNPPYNGYAGIATIEEERDLTNAYREAIPGLPAPQGQGLNDLYIRFFRIAERRIVGDANVHGNESGCGIVSFISNYSWLDGLSHTTMRDRYLRTFNDIYIDNLHGDRRISEYAPDGRTSETVFAVTGTSVGIRIGTAIGTLVRKTIPNTEAEVHYRDFENARASERRKALMRSIKEQESGYTPLIVNRAMGLPFKPRKFENNYMTWPRLPEFFDVSFAGVKTSRDSLVVDIDFERLEERMRKYLDPEVSDEALKEIVTDSMESTKSYDAHAVRHFLQTRVLRKFQGQVTEEERKRLLAAAFRPWQIRRYTYRPFDLRWIYWEPETELLDRKRSEALPDIFPGNRFLEARQHESGTTFTRGAITSSLSDNFGNGLSTFFPFNRSVWGVMDGKEFGHVGMPNIGIGWDYLYKLYPRELIEDEDAHTYLHLHVVATLHAPQYRTENVGALLGDWPRIPLPATAELLAHSASLGRRLAELLDAESSVNLVAEWSFLAALKLPRDPNLDEALKLTAGWGHKGQGSTVTPGRGLSPERPWTDAEREKLAALAAAQSLTLEVALTLLGETCVDVYLNGNAHWSAVPVNVWNYTLGGYQVLKKWLSYREFTAEPASPLLHRALHAEEAAYFAQVVRRIAAILLLGPALDSSYRSILPTAKGLPAPPVR